MAVSLSAGKARGRWVRSARTEKMRSNHTKARPRKGVPGNHRERARIRTSLRRSLTLARSSFTMGGDASGSARRNSRTLTKASEEWVSACRALIGRRSNGKARIAHRGAILSTSEHWRQSTSCRLESSDLAHQPHHDAEYLQRAFGSDDRKSLVLRTQDESPALQIETLERELIVDDRDHDFAAPRAGALFDDDEISVKHASVDHGIALDPHEHRSRRVLDEIIVESQRVRGAVVDRAWQSRMNRRFRQRSLKEPPRRCQQAVGRRLHEASELESRHQRRDRGFRAQPKQCANRRIRRQRAMCCVVILQGFDVGTIVRHSRYNNERSFVRQGRSAEAWMAASRCSRTPPPS